MNLVALDFISMVAMPSISLKA